MRYTVRIGYSDEKGYDSTETFTVESEDLYGEDLNGFADYLSRISCTEKVVEDNRPLEDLGWWYDDYDDRDKEAVSIMFTSDEY